MAWERPTLALGVFLAFAVLLVFSWRRGRLGWAFLGITVALVGLWLAAAAAVRSDYRDADGYIDCWPSCSALQDGVGIALWWSPIAFVVLGVIAAVLAAVSGPRRHSGSHSV